MSRDKTKVSIRNRTLFFAFVFLALIVILFCRLFYWQVVKSDELKSGALAQQTMEKEITPKRGTIFDRNGTELAVSATVDTVTVSPDTVAKAKNVEDIANTLSEILGMSKEDITEIVTRNSQFEFIAKKIDADKASKIRQYISGIDDMGNELTEEQMKGHDLSGISLVEDTKRFYPGGHLASHVVGFTGTDNQGLEGIEAIYDKYLKGKSGKIVTSAKSSGSIPSDYEKYYDAQDGNNLVLTIDQTFNILWKKHLMMFIFSTSPPRALVFLLPTQTPERCLPWQQDPPLTLITPVFFLQTKQNLQPWSSFRHAGETRWL